MSSADIAKLGLPDLPATKVAIAAKAIREQWPVKQSSGLGGQRRLFQIPDEYLPSDQRQDSGGKELAQSAVSRAAQVRQEGGLGDDDLLRAVIVAVERWTKKNDAASDNPERKAALIALLFRYFQAEGKVDDAKIQELLKAVA